MLGCLVVQMNPGLAVELDAQRPPAPTSAQFWCSTMASSPSAAPMSGRLPACSHWPSEDSRAARKLGLWAAAWAR